MLSPQLSKSIAGATGLVHDVSHAGHVKMLDGLDDRWAPQYLLEQQPLVDHVNPKDMLVKISDLDSGKWYPYSSLEQSRQLTRDAISLP